MYRMLELEPSRAPRWHLHAPMHKGLTVDIEFSELVCNGSTSSRRICFQRDAARTQASTVYVCSFPLSSQRPVGLGVSWELSVMFRLLRAKSIHQWIDYVFVLGFACCLLVAALAIDVVSLRFFCGGQLLCSLLIAPCCARKQLEPFSRPLLDSVLSSSFFLTFLPLDIHVCWAHTCIGNISFPVRELSIHAYAEKPRERKREREGDVEINNYTHRLHPSCNCAFAA